ncbi:FliM/FliN family flagellar motor switch protein [Congregibacter litoralis]|uniref:Flagellar motor switch protein FliM n=1 Tax=Congregibacter litoralis KT71 TaxID=314285 RepID=A4A5Y9_9GAMM|nr:FliM/FliN family flagellar motor switch protein [Congregibacter litoralis]EAQ98436.1 Flagellar motor switch protein [Congregibacter litoralis KT71]
MASEDVLTEGEIDALMESVDDDTSAADAADDGQFRRFDFAAREQSLLREFTALGPLVERHAEALGEALESGFSIEFTVRGDTPSLLTVADAVASLERTVAVSTTTLSPLAGPVFAIAPADLLSFVVNAYFGGGSGGPAESARSNLTPTELRLAERIAEFQLSSMINSWVDKLPLEAGEINTLGMPDRLEMLPASEMLLRIAFTLSAGDFSSALSVMLPFAALEPYRERFAPPRKQDDVFEGQTWEPFFRRELPGIELEVAGVLATQSIALADLLELEAGAVIPLAPAEQVSLKVDNVTLAEGRYGSFDGVKAVQLHRLASLLFPAAS